MNGSIITPEARSRMATHTPSETLLRMREVLLADHVLNAAARKRRMDAEWSDVTMAHEADAHQHRRRTDEPAAD